MLRRARVFFRQTIPCMTSSDFIPDTTKCPLCGRPNDCQLCNADTPKAQCWCWQVEFLASLLARVPVELENQVCICRDRVAAFHRERAIASAPA
jgi:hypothetical protein